MVDIMPGLCYPTRVGKGSTLLNITMNLIFKKSLQNAGVWETYKLRHNILENASPLSTAQLWDYADDAEKILRYNIHGDGETEFIFQDETGLDADDAEEEYGEWLDKHTSEIISNVVQWLATQFTMQNGKIILYRAITAPQDWVETGGLTKQGLGVFWSWDAQAAEAHWGEYTGDQNEYLLIGAVTPNEVDWVTTIVANGSYAYQDEREVRLKDNATVELIDVHRIVNDVPWDIEGSEPYLGKQYPAA